jgi:hypothetical protein
LKFQILCGGGNRQIETALFALAESQPENSEASSDNEGDDPGKVTGQRWPQATPTGRFFSVVPCPVLIGFGTRDNTLRGVSLNRGLVVLSVE